MTGRSRLITATLMASLASTLPLAAQTPAPAAPPAPRGAQELARGWTALAAGRAAEAETVSDALLKITPRDHDALALKVRARLAGRGVPAALDTYEAWLPGVRQREDVFLLETIATGLVESHAGSSDAAVRAKALELMAALGNRDAAAQLTSLMSSGTSSATAQGDAALARLGDEAAVTRLAGRVKAGGARDVSDAIDALRDGGVKGAAGVIAGALDPSRPLPTRMAAARALGQLGDATHVPQLKQALKDPDPPVRVMAAAALARLGDASSAELMQTYANSPVGDLRLIAVEAGAAGNPTGPWVGVASGVLQDPDPLVRLRAAELLLQHAAEPGAAAEVFAQALGDSNPAMRHAAAQRLDRLPPAALERDLPTLRKLLRDASPLVQLEAAAGILRISGAR
jgi:HEAT repeat protein